MNIIPIIVAVLNAHSPAVDVAKMTKTTVDETLIRYESIASDMAKTINSEQTVYNGVDAKKKSLALLMSISIKESALRNDVDDGTLRGDHGNSWCLAQINLGGNKIAINDDGGVRYVMWNAKDGWTGPDLVHDRKKCFKVSLAFARTSFKCPTNDEFAKLNMYASGKCTSGYRASRERIELAKAIENELTFSEQDIIDYVEEIL